MSSCTFFDHWGSSERSADAVVRHVSYSGLVWFRSGLCFNVKKWDSENKFSVTESYLYIHSNEQRNGLEQQNMWFPKVGHNSQLPCSKHGELYLGHKVYPHLTPHGTQTHTVKLLRCFFLSVEVNQQAVDSVLLQPVYCWTGSHQVRTKCICCLLRLWGNLMQAYIYGWNANYSSGRFLSVQTT